jgi:adenosine deaminase
MSLLITPSKEQIKRLPKVLLHDHLDGGLRPETVIEIADRIGYRKLPTSDPKELAKWFEDSCNSGSLVRYLETFAHTIAVMQTTEGIIQVARECVIDLARDSVIYAEVRGAPELLTEQGLSSNQVIDATLEGFKQGMAEAKREGYKIRVESLLCGMRQSNKSMMAAKAVVDYRGKGVVGFDIAGPEDGFPPINQLQEFEFLRKENAHFTIHAGEAFGVPSIWQAVQICGAERIGHGVRIIEDIDFSSGKAKLGLLAAYIRDRRIALEICPTSNLQTGIAKSYEEHPIGKLAKLDFNVTLNTDNRLMSNTSMSHEMEQCVKHFGWNFSDLQNVTINALNSSFIDYEEKQDFIEEIIRPEFEKISSS